MCTMCSRRCIYRTREEQVTVLVCQGMTGYNLFYQPLKRLHDERVASISLSNWQWWIIGGICGKTKESFDCCQAGIHGSVATVADGEREMIYDSAGILHRTIWQRLEVTATRFHEVSHTFLGKCQIPGSLHKREIIWLKLNMAVLHGLLGAFQ